MGQSWLKEYAFNIRKVSYVHIPRTGGTALRKVLTKYVNPNQLFNVDIGQHRPISSKCSIDHGYKYFTFLRNPIDRVMSHYTLLRVIEGNKWDEYINDFETLCSKCWTLNNLACQMISGHTGEVVTESIFNMAKQNINKFYFVGDFSDYNSSVIDLVLKLTGNKIVVKDIPCINTMAQLNGVNKLNKAQKSSLESRNLYDIMLYEYYKQSYIRKQ